MIGSIGNSPLGIKDTAATYFSTSFSPAHIANVGQVLHEDN
jgi:hypothetical protein